MTGIKCDRESFGDLIRLTPRNSATIIFIEYTYE